MRSRDHGPATGGRRADHGGLAYGILTGSGGFEDVWSLTSPGEPGLTCCHDADLRNDHMPAWSLG